MAEVHDSSDRDLNIGASDDAPVHLEVRDLYKEFDVPEGIEVAVDEISFTVDNGEFVTVVGPSGCGKTTTLRCVAGLETPTSGDVKINDFDIVDVPPNRRDMAMMFQDIALYPHMKIKDNIAYPLKVRNIPRDERYEEAKEAAELMQIPDLLDKHPGEVSGGQRQRAALARTIVQDPQVFLMDEPLSDLDAKLKSEMRKEIQHIHRRVNTPTLYVTHDQEEAMTMSDKIIVMNNGCIEQSGSPSEVYNQPENMFVASFIGNPAINFIPASVENLNENSLSVNVDGTSIDLGLEYLETENIGSEVVLGVRPEDVTFSQTDGIEVLVTLTERIGDRIMTTLDALDRELRAFISASKQFEEDSSVYLTFEHDRVHVFDPDTSECVGRGPELLNEN